MLRPAVNDMDDLWFPQVQQVLESNALMPSVMVDFLSTDGLTVARTLHMDMKMYIKNKGNPCPGSLLLEEVPETPLDFWEATEAAEAPARSGESNASLATRFPRTAWSARSQSWTLSTSTPKGKSAFGVESGRRNGRSSTSPWHVGDKPGQLANLERCTRPYGAQGEFHHFTKTELEDQVNHGLRPSTDTIQKLFWAPGLEGSNCFWHRAVSTWNFPSLCHRLAHQNTLKEIYAIWQQMPLAMEALSRGQHSAEKSKNKLQRHLTIKKEVKTFVQELGIKDLLSDIDSWRHLCKEMGKFLAAQSFLTHTPSCVMELPPADIHDTKSHMRERAICDERISLPLSAFRELDTIYTKLTALVGTQEAMVEVKVNWRCTNVIWWCSLVDDEEVARGFCAKLGYSTEETEAFITKAREHCPAGGGLVSKAEGNHPALGQPQQCHGAGIQRKALWQPPPSWVLGQAGMRACAQLGEPLGICSQRAWGRKPGGFACKYCDGFWKAKAGSSRVVQLLGRSGQNKLALQLILDERSAFTRSKFRIGWSTTCELGPLV